MEIRVTCYGPVGVAAVALATEGDELPRSVRIVDEATADAVEEIVLAHVDEPLVAVDLDALVEEARERVSAG